MFQRPLAISWSSWPSASSRGTSRSNENAGLTRRIRSALSSTAKGWRTVSIMMSAYERARSMACPIVEQNQEGPRVRRALERNDLDAHRTPILHPQIVMGRRPGTACLLNRGGDVDEQFGTYDATQIEAGGAARGLQIRAD